VAAVEAGRGLSATDPALGDRVIGLAQTGFLDGLAAGCLVASGVTLVGALLCARYLPAQPRARPAAEPALAPAPSSSLEFEGASSRGPMGPWLP